MMCPKCFATIPATAKFCNICGTPVEQGDTAAFAAGEIHAAPVPPIAPAYMPPMMDPEDAPLSTGQFLAMQLLMIIPIANIVLLFVWGFSAGTNINRRNWARATLIKMAIGVALTILLMIIMLPIILYFLPEICYFFEQLGYELYYMVRML